MRGLLRFACLVLATFGLLHATGIDRPTHAAPAFFQDVYGSFSRDLGPIHVEIAVSPPVARPKDTITIDITLTNRVNHSVSPSLDISLPAVLSGAMARYPAGTTFDYQRNMLSWQPVLLENEDTERLSLSYTVAVAEISRPEQELTIQISADETISTEIVKFWVGSPPFATFTVNPQVVAVGQPVALHATPGGPGPFTQTWSLGDGRQITAQNPEVTFATPGTYEIRLQVANPLTVATAIGGVTVVPQPTALFSLEDDYPVAGQELRYLNESGGERPLSYHWYFGDGVQSREASPVHTYAAPGTYDVRLVVSSQYGESEFVMPVTVGSNPVADMVLPEQIDTGESFEAMAFGDDTITSLRWDMGDGSQLEGDVINHTYYRPGEFFVSLFATNEYGETVVTRQVHVEGGRIALFMPVIFQPVGGEEIATAAQEGAQTTAAVMAAPQSTEDPETDVTTAVPLQSGRISPTPGGASAGPAEAISQPITLPPQSPLAHDASIAEQLLWYVNEARRLHGLSALSYNYELSIAAQLHSEDMALNPDVMHIGSDGSRPPERQQRYGYPGAYGGEAVAWGWESPVLVVEFWVNSAPHRVLILNPDADEIGVGHTADGHAPNIWFWAVEFGILPGAP